ncbi:ABC transporter ATP-binding protein [Telmatocola sphagniphila]|uniref:ABC transporter ATP-binding protein n=1 Tax=Telmatocola sphagniphila TaxID=1123043 RepID=A0A8E6B228_9BACT|nr:ABC transporter ATP-binding protein [Telmatocola sphagniphila]QVL30387.1 ABC transporter ATP-binding protein [Telmatocola sphagniphila]
MESAVRCVRVEKFFGEGDTRVQVLRGIDTNVRFGEMTLLVGPSGCGKTTLISLIAGLLDPTEGEVWVLSECISKLRGGRKTAFRSKNIGFVFQQYNLMPALTAAENAAVPLIIAGWSRTKAVDRAAEMLRKVGLSDKIRSLPAQLSGGQQQRVAIARALVHEPRLLVCDEPTAALDGKSGQTVMELLKEVACKPDRAVIIVTHDNRVYKFGDRILEMADGLIERIVDGASVATLSA